MTKLTALIITFNEEKNIGRCLQSLSGLADEIIVVDSFSTDKTKEIALKNGAKVFENKFEGHIEQKNFAITLANNDFIISLDADECLSNKLYRNIEIEKNNHFPNKAYSFNRLTNYCGKWIHHSGWYPDVKTRIFNKNDASWAGENPHDKLVVNENVIAKHLKGDLYHYSFYTISEHIKQIDKFSDIAAKEAFKKGNRGSLFKIIFAPGFKFVRDYLFNLGFLDGFYGLVICYLSSVATFLKYVKLKQLNYQKHLQ